METATENLERRYAERVIEIVGRHLPNVPGAVHGINGSSGCIVAQQLLAQDAPAGKIKIAIAG
jgi:hypothetical protein